MKEIRRDSITGDSVIYSSFRNKRPLDKVNSTNDFDGKDNEYSSSCPFCRGNEKEKDVLKEELLEDGDWVAKCVANKFPILDTSTKEIFGDHEVIIETNRHNGSYYDMSIEEYKNTFRLFSSRYRELSKTEGIKYVSIFKNSMRNAGASLMHPHSQIISFNMIPPEIEKELEVAKRHIASTNRNLYDDIIASEISYGKRVIYNGKYLLAFVPYATRYNGEVRIISKTSDDISDWNEDYIEELSYIFKNLFSKLYIYQGEIPFNLLLHTYPLECEGRNIFRTHIHIVPRKYNFGGFELSTNFFVCGTNPDELASELKFK